MMQKILVIDDESQIRKLLQITLQSNGYQVEEAVTASEGLNAATIHAPDLILLDIGLPDEDGHAVLRKLRNWYTSPVIIISVQSNEEDIINALNHGATDYLVKPFRTGDLLTRIKSALGLGMAIPVSQVFRFNRLYIDLAAGILKKDEEIISLTATEYKLLALFVTNEGKVLTHQHLLSKIWGPGYEDQSQYLRAYIGQLRKKIEQDPNRPIHIITESGVGYRFVSG